MGMVLLARRWQRVVAVLGVNSEIRAIYAHLDLPVRAADNSLGGIAQGVLIARLTHGGSVGGFNGVAGKLFEDLAATGGSPVYHELSRSAIENMYAQVMGDARNQYTLGYYATRPKVPTSSAYRSIEVVVHRSGLKIYAKDGYYPAPTVAR